MSSPDMSCAEAPLEYLGCPREYLELRALNDQLNAKVLAQVSDTEELVMLNNFSRECNEYQYKKSTQERISDIESWRWVLEDLAKRLEDAVKTLQYEHNALRVVVQRVQAEIDDHSRIGARPGAFCPLSDVVEDAIMQEFKFLIEHKTKFEKMILDLENEISTLNKTRNRILVDVVNKQRAINVEESCASIGLSNSYRLDTCKRKKKRASPVCRWENRCVSLKTSGLRALSNAAIIRQQVRGARTHLSIAAQAYASRVDSAIRRRLHSNKIKLQDLKWQREEALRDYKSLDEELTGTEQNLIDNMEQERVVEARLVDRTLRPLGELIKDDVDRKLRDELGRLRNFSKQLRTNMDSISSLQNHLADAMTRIDNCAEDLFQVVCLDEERIRFRLGEFPECTCHNAGPPEQSYANNQPSPARSQSDIQNDGGLSSIPEENENEYPFDV